MHRLSPLLVVLLAATAFAQSAQPAPASDQPGPANNYGFAPAPKPGHPLDPNDVAILTGKSGNSAPAQQQYAAPQFYYSYPTGGSTFNQSTVGNAFGQQPNFSNGYGNFWRNRRRRPTMDWGWGSYYGGYSDLNSSQFADVTTEATPFHIRRRQKPGFGPTLFFGNRTPGFGNQWTPNLWSSPGAHFPVPTGSKSSPGLRP